MMMQFGEDLPDLIEKPCTTLKSPEELERLTVDERLDPIERSVYLLSSGQEVQRLSVVYSLPSLLVDHYQECVRRIVPKIREVVRVADVDMQLAACDVFTDILRRKLCPTGVYIQYFLQTMFQCMDSKDPLLADRWVVGLIDVINLLPKDVVAKEILAKTIAKGNLDQPIRCRLAYCRLLGAAVEKFDSTAVRRDILPMVRSLCEDVDYDVRACMARNLEPVAKSLSTEAIHSDLLPVLVELLKDEQCEVRLAWLDAIISLLPMLEHSILVEEIIPLLMSYCKEARHKKDDTLRTVAWNFGRLCHGLAKHLDEPQRQFFLTYYKRYLCRMRRSRSPSLGNKKQLQKPGKSSSGHLHGSSDDDDDDGNDQTGSACSDEEECRKCAAYNMPAMVSFVTAKHFRAELLPCFISLCSDSSTRVRSNIASGFHEVVGILRVSSACLIDSLISLLNDNSSTVLAGGFISHLPDTLHVLCQCTKAADFKINEILGAVVKCEAVIFASNDWRLQIQYADALASLPNYLSMEALNAKIVPLTFSKLKNARAIPVRKAMARAALQLIRFTANSHQREALCKRLVEEYAQGKSFHHRVLYIDICEAAMEIFSRGFVAQYFITALLRLHSDKVANVRIRLCAVLPLVKCSLKQPRDKELVQLLDQCVKNLLMKETDRDVMEARDKAVERLDKLCVEMVTNLSLIPSLEDEEDFKKEKEELEMFDRCNGTPDGRKSTEVPQRRKSLATPPEPKSLVTPMRKPPQRTNSGAGNLPMAVRRSVPTDTRPTTVTAPAQNGNPKLPMTKSQNSISSAPKKKVSTSLSSGTTALPTNSVTGISGLHPIGNEKRTSALGSIDKQRRASLADIKHK